MKPARHLHVIQGGATPVPPVSGTRMRRDDADLPPRPKTRGECQGQPRPCPYVSCRYHLYLDVKAKTGTIKHNWPDLEVWQLEESCALDLADRHAMSADRYPMSQEEVALHMGWTHQYIDVVEKVAVRKLRDLARRFPKSAWAQSVAHLLQLMTGDQNAKR